MLELAISETVRMQSIATCFETVDEIVPTAAWGSLFSHELAQLDGAINGGRGAG